MSAIWILAAFFLLVAGGVAAAGYWFVLRPQAAGGAEMGAATALASTSAPGSLAEVLQRLGELIPSSPRETGFLRKRLVAAGYRSQSAVAVFWGLKCSAMLGLALLCSISGLSSANFLNALVAALAGVGLGYILPDRILGARIDSRRSRLREALPDALDLMVLCLEAGQSLDQAMQESSHELKRSYPDLSSELALVNLELRAGTSRAEALRKLADRNGEPELRKLANVMVQADRFGTSLGPALRTHARYLRIRRKQKAEEAARKISIKLIFPIFFLIFPCMLLATVGPAVLQLFVQVLPMMRGE